MKVEILLTFPHYQAFI